MEILQQILKAVEIYKEELLQKMDMEWTEDDQEAYEMLLRKEKEIIDQMNDAVIPITV